MTNNIIAFFWFCAGLGKHERNRLQQKHIHEHSFYASIGAAVLSTTILSAASNSYAAYTYSESLIVSLFSCLLWGAMIFNIDRLIVMLRPKSGRLAKMVGPALRVVLAVLIASFIALPLEVKIFGPEIDAQERIEQIENEFEVDEKLQSGIAYRNDLIEQNRRDELELNKTYQVFVELETQAVIEADGSGGTKQRGAGPIYRIKKRRADIARQDYIATANATVARIDARKQLIADYDRNIDAKRQRAMAANAASTGLLGRRETLGRRMDANPTTWTTVWLFTLLIIALEILPISAKSLAAQTTYELYREAENELYRILYGIGLVRVRQHQNSEKDMEAARYAKDLLDIIQGKKPPFRADPKGLFHS